MRKTEQKRKGRLWVAAAAVVVLLTAACAIYVSDYYRADTQAITAFACNDGITQQQLDDGTRIYMPRDPAAGFIFYPGGKVEHTAYDPLMRACAAKGLLCILVEMPFHLAVLDMDAAEGIPAQYPHIKTWYIGGHSLGGAMAASHLSEHTEVYAGLILLGAYSTADLSRSGIEVLCVYGSEDTVLDHKTYKEKTANLPPDYSQVVLDGGCHAYFGMYGPQKGDGVPSISNETQIAATADAIAAFAAG